MGQKRALSSSDSGSSISLFRDTDQVLVMLLTA